MMHPISLTLRKKFRMCQNAFKLINVEDAFDIISFVREVPIVSRFKLINVEDAFDIISL